MKNHYIIARQVTALLLILLPIYSACAAIHAASACCGISSLSNSSRGSEVQRFAKPASGESTDVKGVMECRMPILIDDGLMIAGVAVTSRGPTPQTLSAASKDFMTINKGLTPLTMDKLPL